MRLVLARSLLIWRHAFTTLGRASHAYTSLRCTRLPQHVPSTRPHLAPRRLFASTAENAPHPPEYLSDGERTIFNKIVAELRPTKLEVQDISGGCGSMYGLDIVSPRFEGLSIVKQHKLVNQILAKEIKDWHGMQLKTKASS